jgi:site-specific DNA-methyltransferase (adenine-specific)
MGTLYYGDNLDILRRYLKDETVDLVYLDPPFNSAQNYNAFLLMDGKAIERPSSVAAVDETFKKAPKSKAKSHEQGGLNLA